MKIQHGLVLGAMLSLTTAAPLLLWRHDADAGTQDTRELSSPPIHMPSCENSNSIPQGFKCINPTSTVQSVDDPANATAAPATQPRY